MGRLVVIVLVLAGLLGGAYWWFILDNGSTTKTYTIDMAEVRRLADSLPGDKASEIRIEEVARFAFPATAVVAGDGWKTRSMPVYSFQVVFPTMTGIIDTALDSKIGEGQVASFDETAYGRMSAAIGNASFIVITHEHMDHIGGLTAREDLNALAPALRLTEEQVAHPEKMAPAAFKEGALEGYTPIAYDTAVAIAPGIVLIKAPGHTPGSQLVFVELADGREILFLGDVAWAFKNVETIRTRARLVSQFILQEDRAAVLAQLAELSRLHTEEPGIVMVAGHDGAQVGGLIADGTLKIGHQ